MIKGFLQGYGPNESVIDIVIKKTELYYEIYGKLPTTAQVWRDMPESEILAIMDLGNIRNVQKKFSVRMILIGGEDSKLDERKERLGDSKEQATG